MLATLRVRKIDNGFKGIIEWASDNDALLKGSELFNRNFKGFSAGSEMAVTVNISKTYRRVVKNVRPWNDSTGIAPAQVAPVTVELNSNNDNVIDTVVSPKEEPIKVTNKSKKAILNGYFIDQEARLTFTTAHNMSILNPGRAVKVMMVGPSGYGKTTVPKLFAQMTGRNFLRMNCATVRDPEEWFGYREAVEGNTVFHVSEFAKAIGKGNLVVVLDEFNRLEPWLHNTLFPLLDDDGCTVVHGQEFSIGENVIVVGTINTGYKYTGTFELDEALLNRFELMLEVGPMTHQSETKVLRDRTGVGADDASTIVTTASALRSMQVVCSTRTTLLIANMVMSGMNIREAFESAVVRRLPNDVTSGGERKAVMDAVNANLYNYSPRTPDDDVFSDKVVKVATEQSGDVALEPTGEEYTLTLSAKTPNLGAANLINLLVKLPARENITTSAASALVNEMRKGSTVRIVLTHLPHDARELSEALSDCGLTGSFKKVGA